MKIAHIGLASFYTEGMTYQDNQLAEQNVRDGHEVLYISNAAKYENGGVVETGYQDLMTPGGVRLVRLPYVRVLNRFVSGKLRRVTGLYPLLADFAPDVILSHDLCYWSVRDVLRYKKDHPRVKLYADTHTAACNSGTNWLSLHILHRMFYRALVQRRCHIWTDTSTWARGKRPSPGRTTASRNPGWSFSPWAARCSPAKPMRKSGLAGGRSWASGRRTCC